MDEQHNLQDPSINATSPVNLINYRDKIDQTFSFLITGKIQGSVFGTNIYTDDSSIATAAVHAGVLSVDETKTLFVKILPGQLNYQGSTQNEVTSSSYGVWMGSYMFTNASLTTITNLVNYRHKLNEIISISVTGLIGGSVYGTNIYTDDSNVGTAAVHAGVLSIGETKTVEVRILPGQSSYKGSTQNGVISSSYGLWLGSYVFIQNIISSITDSMNLTRFRDKVGQSLYFLVTGNTGGPVYGTDIYTDDSNINAAAVHAGVVKHGETKSVIVNILPGQSNYQGSTKNGLTSSSYGQWPVSFRFVNNITTSISTIANLTDYRNKVNQTLSVSVTGSLGGIIYGTKIYTDDSIVNTAAIHAGIVNVGETKTVDIKILSGQTSYLGSTQNGVTSSSYGAWGGSYMFTTNTINCIMAPIDLIHFREKTNQLLSFVVTGKNEGSIFGTNIYSDDSNIAAAAVHAGVVKNNEMKTINVKILSGQMSYEGSIRNGITSLSYGSWSGSFVFIDNTIADQMTSIKSN
ncbi:hypothetical protein I4U23_017246 [Adineta vaga]|nr:hypothetical protein I4U23_017246 [Adineta vaga]